MQLNSHQRVIIQQHMETDAETYSQTFVSRREPHRIGKKCILEMRIVKDAMKTSKTSTIKHGL